MPLFILGEIEYHSYDGSYHEDNVQPVAYAVFVHLLIVEKAVKLLENEVLTVDGLAAELG